MGVFTGVLFHVWIANKATAVVHFWNDTELPQLHHRSSLLSVINFKNDPRSHRLTPAVLQRRSAHYIIKHNRNAWSKWRSGRGYKKRRSEVDERLETQCTAPKNILTTAMDFLTYLGRLKTCETVTFDESPCKSIVNNYCQKAIQQYIALHFKLGTR